MNSTLKLRQERVERVIGTMASQQQQQQQQQTSNSNNA
jgi:hypothetical protein